MRRPSAPVWLVLASLALSVSCFIDQSASAADEAQAGEAEVTVVPSAEERAPISREELLYTRSLLQEMKLARETRKAQVDELKRRFLATKSPELARQLQQQIHELKLSVEIDLLEIQLRHARKMGRDDLARDAEASLLEFEKLKNPHAAIRADEEGER